MRRVLASLILLPLAACGPTNADFDLRLREMAGSNERNLLGSMGRIPDSTYQLDEEAGGSGSRWAAFPPPLSARAASWSGP